MKKPILIFGATGYVGYYLSIYLKEYFNVIPVKTGPSQGIFGSFHFIESDITNLDSIRQSIESYGPEIIINCVGYANVDLCERETHIAEKLNFTFVKDLVDIVLRKKNIKLIHLSSNAVYDGGHPPYSEISKAKPINYYGKIKLQADEYIENQLSNFLIVRPITLIGQKEIFHRHNPASFIISKLRNNEKIQLVDDIFVNFLYIQDLLIYIGELIRLDSSGVFNISGDEILSRYDLGVRISRVLHLDPALIERVDSDRFKTIAPRPKNTSFDNQKIKQTTKYFPVAIDSALNQIAKLI